MAADSIRGLVSFVKTVSTGSFAAAARQLSISAVAVSKNVSRLEHELGVRLLQRSTRKLGLTEEGRLLYERCVTPLRELDSARAAARERLRSVSGSVRVTSVTPFGLSYVLPLIPAFTAAYPNVEVEFHLDDNVSDMIAQGYDVGFRVGRITNATVIAQRIATLRFVVCGAPEYLAQHPAPEAPSDLAAHNCLRFRHRASGRFIGWTLVRDGERTTADVSGNFISNDLTALITAATHGQGLVYAPLPRVLPMLRHGELQVVLPDWLSPGIEVFLHYPSRRGLPARVRAFVQFMTERLRKQADLQGDPRTLLKPFRANQPPIRRQPSSGWPPAGHRPARRWRR
jgi:DNA-binding transcriptional LysR family regulator